MKQRPTLQNKSDLADKSPLVEGIDDYENLARLLKARNSVQRIEQIRYPKGEPL
jgi:hypothetical protein